MTHQIWFISGHLDLTQEEFDEHYARRIREAYDRNDSFVVGDAPGCDDMAQKLLGTLLGAKYRVFHMLENPRCNPNGTLSLVGGYASDELRDDAMTRASTGDIAWVRPGKRKNNGTAKNLARRLEWNRQLRREEIATWPEFKYAHNDDCTGYVVYPVADECVRFITDTVRLPQEVVDRENAAWREYAKARDEIAKLIREQEEDI